MTQTETVVDYLQKHKALGSSTAIYELGIHRLSDIIFRLRKRGMNIETETYQVKNRYGGTSRPAVYRLVD